VIKANGRQQVAIFIYFRFMQSHELSFEFKARYFTLGELTSSTTAIWIVLHGYGQLASYFIRRFDLLSRNNIYVIAPEALSRFYVDPLLSTGRTSDRVGATWMTKENRLVDIENYLSYLDTLYAHLNLPSTLPVTVLGFSQGAATASRWIAGGKIRFNRMILWSGVFPPDMNFAPAKEILKGKEIAFVYGKSDPFLNDSSYHSMEMISTKLEIHPQLIPFEGGHEILEETLKKLF